MAGFLFELAVWSVLFVTAVASGTSHYPGSFDVGEGWMGWEPSRWALEGGCLQLHSCFDLN
jgi:hypothetical protein